MQAKIRHVARMQHAGNEPGTWLGVGQ